MGWERGVTAENIAFYFRQKRGEIFVYTSTDITDKYDAFWYDQKWKIQVKV